MKSSIENLIHAEEIAIKLFESVISEKLIIPNKSEKELNNEIYKLAEQKFGIKKYWHKRIVRAGKNTLFPYDENPPNLIIQKDDILFIDFGPIIDEWEADLGRTYVLGENEHKVNLKLNIEKAWYQTKNWIDTNKNVTGSEVWTYVNNLAYKMGYKLGGEIAGHIIGLFPHEKIEDNQQQLYIHKNNNEPLYFKSEYEESKNWILEIHFIDQKNEIGGFFEQLLR